MIKRGSSAFQQEKERKVGGGSGGASRLQVRLGPGESALLRFYKVGPEYPVVIRSHYVPRLPRGQQTILCSEELCVACYYSASDKGVGRSNQKSVFWVKDYTLQHRLDSEVRVPKPMPPGKKAGPNDYWMTKYPPCASQHKRPCAYCAQGNSARTRGSMPFELSQSHTDGILALADGQAREFCRGCCSVVNGQGTLSVSGYACPFCHQDVEFYPDTQVTTRCGSCGKVGTPEEHLQCSECGNPERTILDDFVVKVTRHGEDKSTRYEFHLQLPPQPLDAAETEEIEKYVPDWEQVYAPPSSSTVASLLGVVNPYAGRADDHAPPAPPKPHGTVSYGGARPANPGGAAPKRTGNPFNRAREVPDDDYSDDNVPF